MELFDKKKQMHSKPSELFLERAEATKPIQKKARQQPNRKITTPRTKQIRTVKPGQRKPYRSRTVAAQSRETTKRPATEADRGRYKSINASVQSTKVTAIPTPFFLTTVASQDAKREKVAVKNSWKTIQKNMKKGIQEFPLAEHVVPCKMDSIQRFCELFEEFPKEEIGNGQFGVVYRGLHRESGRKAAIKVIGKDRPGIIKFRLQILKNEVAILQSLDHPAIVKLECMLEVPSKIVIVMEGMQGDLFSFIEEKGVMNERFVKIVMIQVLSAVQYLHARGIVHCDLKPENILLSDFDSPLPQAKLCDFGFARFLEDGEVCKELVGTTAYSAPEVIKMAGFDKSSDMWSFGATIFVALSDAFPFNKDAEVTEDDASSAVLFLDDKWRDISSRAMEFIHKLLQIQMSSRLTVEEAMEHSWFEDCATDLKTLEERLGLRREIVWSKEVKQTAAKAEVQKKKKARKVAAAALSPVANRTRRRMTAATSSQQEEESLPTTPSRVTKVVKQTVPVLLVPESLPNQVELENLPRNSKVLKTQNGEASECVRNTALGSISNDGKRKLTFDDKPKIKKARKGIETPKKIRRPKMAIVYYKVDNRERVREQYPHLRFKQIQQLLGEEWKLLLDKSKWRAMAAADKLRFDKENNWRQPRRAINFWAAERMTAIIAQSPGISIAQAMAQARKEWLEVQDKNKWVVMAEQANQHQLDKGVQWGRKGPRPAYMFYEIENRDRMRKMHPQFNSKEITKLLQAEWKTLPDKSKWKQLAAEDKLRIQMQKIKAA